MNNQIRDIVSIFIGSFFVGWSMLSFILISLSKRWKPIKGKVLEADMESDGFLSGEYGYNLKYSYSVNNVEYYSTFIYASEILGRLGGNIFLIKKMLKEFIPKKEIIVYYNPRNPKRACLKTNYGVHLIFFFGIGLLFLLLGIFSLLGYIKISNVWA